MFFPAHVQSFIMRYFSFAIFGVLLCSPGFDLFTKAFGFEERRNLRNFKFVVIVHSVKNPTDVYGKLKDDLDSPRKGVQKTKLTRKITPYSNC